MPPRASDLTKKDMWSDSQKLTHDTLRVNLRKNFRFLPRQSTITLTLMKTLWDVNWNSVQWMLCHMERDVKSCQVIASDKSNFLRKVQLLLKRFPSNKIFHSFGGRMSCYNCRKPSLQTSTTIISGTLQNNTWLVNIFGIFIRLVI